MRFYVLMAAAALFMGSISGDVNGPVINRGWTFAEEAIRLNVEDGYFRVSAEYLFTAVPDAKPLALLLAFPRDKTIGAPVLLKAGIDCGPASRALPVAMGPDGWRFVLDHAGAARCAVTLEYYQSMSGNRAVYVLQSAREWGRPLERAVLEVRVPEGKACVIGPALGAAGVANGTQVFRKTFVDWVPREDLVVDLLEG